MSRPVVVYLVMVLVLIGGLWAVLKLGGRLVAPEDLAGKWQLRKADSPEPAMGLNIEQSGEFFQVAFDRGPQLDLKLQSHSPVVLENSKCKLTVIGAPGSDDKVIQLQGEAAGSSAGEWTAHRTVRTFPLDVTNHGPTTREAK